MLTFGL